MANFLIILLGIALVAAIIVTMQSIDNLNTAKEIVKNLKEVTAPVESSMSLEPEKGAVDTLEIVEVTEPIDTSDLIEPETEEKVETIVEAETTAVAEPPTTLKNAYDCWTREDILTVVARCVWCEARGIHSQTEQACVIWAILNRIDPNQYPRHIVDVILSPKQFSYNNYAPVVDDHGRSLIDLADDVLSRYEQEQAGAENVGRVLPHEYRYFWGDDFHNYFRTKNHGDNYWDYSLPSPYDS